MQASPSPPALPQCTVLEPLDAGPCRAATLYGGTLRLRGVRKRSAGCVHVCRCEYRHLPAALRPRLNVWVETPSKSLLKLPSPTIAKLCMRAFIAVADNSSRAPGARRSSPASTGFAFHDEVCERTLGVIGGAHPWRHLALRVREHGLPANAVVAMPPVDSFLTLRGIKTLGWHARHARTPWVGQWARSTTKARGSLRAGTTPHALARRHARFRRQISLVSPDLFRSNASSACEVFASPKASAVWKF